MKKGLCKSCYYFFSTMSNPTRLAILEQLRDGPKNVTEISKGLNQDQSMISHNLNPMVQCGFVSVERRWKEHVYSINKETVETIFQALDNHTENYCKKLERCPRQKDLTDV